MDRKQTCYCGLYCENCAVKLKVEPAAKALYVEMAKLGFAEIMQFFPDGEKFWSFLKGMSTVGVCTSCQAGSGNPACKIRLCAKEKNIEMCALCESYPCEHFTEFFKGYPMLKEDNALLREKGWEAWARLQDERHAKGCAFAYGINHIALYVNDLDKMKTFYEKYFNAIPNKMYHNQKTGLKTYFLEFDNGCRLEIMTKENLNNIIKEINNTGYIHLAFSVGSRDKVNEITKRLEKDGYKIISQPRITGDGYYESCILDPENNQIEIVE